MKNASVNYQVLNSFSRITENVPVKECKAPRSGKTLSGYGKKIPTDYMVYFGKRWRRVYCCIFSNLGTLYIGKLEKGNTITVEIF